MSGFMYPQWVCRPVEIVLSHNGWAPILRIIVCAGVEKETACSANFHVSSSFMWRMLSLPLSLSLLNHVCSRAHFAAIWLHFVTVRYAHARTILSIELHLQFPVFNCKNISLDLFSEARFDCQPHETVSSHTNHFPPQFNRILCRIHFIPFLLCCCHRIFHMGHLLDKRKLQLLTQRSPAMTSSNSRNMVHVCVCETARPMRAQWRKKPTQITLAHVHQSH